MISISAKNELPLKQLNAFSDEFIIKLDGAIAKKLKDETKKNLKRRRGPKVAPVGQPPAYQSGKLYKSVKVEKVISGRRSEDKINVVVRASYAGIHEYGGTIKLKNGFIKIPARPYVRPAVAATKKTIPLLAKITRTEVDVRKK